MFEAIDKVLWIMRQVTFNIAALIILGYMIVFSYLYWQDHTFFDLLRAIGL